MVRSSKSMERRELLVFLVLSWDLVVDRHHSSAYRQLSLIDVELMPEGAKEFAASYPRGGREPEGRVVAIRCGELEKASELIRGPYPVGR